MMQTQCVVCGNQLVLTIVYINEKREPTMWKEVEPWYARATNEFPSKLHCRDCGLLYDHEAS